MAESGTDQVQGNGRVDESGHAHAGLETQVDREGRDAEQQPSDRGEEQYVPPRGFHRRLPNGLRLSCGRNARRRKAVEAQIKRLASEATQFLPTRERPAASSAC